MTVTIKSFATKTEREIHDDYLRTVRNGLIQQGIANPQLGPGSDEDNYATALAREIVPIYANSVITGDAQMADTAGGDPGVGQTVGADLVRIMAIYGLAPRPAAPSSGYIVLAASASTTITNGAQLTDASGLRYQVQLGGTFAPGADVPIIAVDVGAATNHNPGDVLQWGTPPTYCQLKQLVAVGGLTGGSDAEDTETARGRLLDRLRNPPGSGNAAQIAKYAEDSTPIVQKAFVYPAVGGPSTCHVAVVGYPSDTNKSREIDATVMSGTVVPYLVGKVPEFTEFVPAAGQGITTVIDQPVDIAIGLALPSAPTASPAGPGGGWIDGSPWPAISGVQTYANVTAIAPGSTTQFTVNAPTAPQDGVSHIAMVDTTTWKIVRAKVLSHSGTAGAYVITIDTPFVNVAAAAGGDLGTLIFPDATNADVYVAALLQAMKLMGPGEKTANASVLGRAFRHPPPQATWPYSLDARLLKQIEDSGAEVLDTTYFFRGATTPTVPATIASPPSCFTPRRLGLYPI